MDLEKEIKRLQTQVNAALAHVEGKHVPQQQFDELMEECALMDDIVQGQRVVLLLLLEAPLLNEDQRRALTVWVSELPQWDAVIKAQEQLDALHAQRQPLEDDNEELPSLEEVMQGTISEEEAALDE